MDERLLIGAAILLLTVAGAGAWRRGGLIERRGLAVFAAGWISIIAVMTCPPSIRAVGLPLVNLLVLGLLVSLTWKSPRPWPIYACGFQALAVALCIASGSASGANPAHWMACGFALAALSTLAIGAWLPARPR